MLKLKISIIGFYLMIVTLTASPFEEYLERLNEEEDLARREQLIIVVPENMIGGNFMQVTLPSGRFISLMIPIGLVPGDSFRFVLKHVQPVELTWTSVPEYAKPGETCLINGIQVYVPVNMSPGDVIGIPVRQIQDAPIRTAMAALPVDQNTNLAENNYKRPSSIPQEDWNELPDDIKAAIVNGDLG